MAQTNTQPADARAVNALAPLQVSRELFDHKESNQEKSKTLQIKSGTPARETVLSDEEIKRIATLISKQMEASLNSKLDTMQTTLEAKVTTLRDELKHPETGLFNRVQELEQKSARADVDGSSVTRIVAEHDLLKDKLAMVTGTIQRQENELVLMRNQITRDRAASTQDNVIFGGIPEKDRKSPHAQIASFCVKYFNYTIPDGGVTTAKRIGQRKTTTRGNEMKRAPRQLLAVCTSKVRAAIMSNAALLKNKYEDGTKVYVVVQKPEAMPVRAQAIVRATNKLHQKIPPNKKKTIIEQKRSTVTIAGLDHPTTVMVPQPEDYLQVEPDNQVYLNELIFSHSPKSYEGGSVFQGFATRAPTRIDVATAYTRIKQVDQVVSYI